MLVCEVELMDEDDDSQPQARPDMSDLAIHRLARLNVAVRSSWL